MRNIIAIPLTLVTAFFIGFYAGQLFPSDIVRTHYSCQQIARFHQDYLMSKYSIDDGFNTNLNNPKRDINQRASNLNARLLEVCTTPPWNSELELANETGVDHAIARILLIHSVILSIGGIPLIYLGDEVANLNDYGYWKSPSAEKRKVISTNNFTCKGWWSCWATTRYA